jgi:hypothetical protein
MVQGTATTKTRSARSRSMWRQNAATRPPLVKSAVMPMIGTTGSGPTVGTSASGSRSPVP